MNSNMLSIRELALLSVPQTGALAHPVFARFLERLQTNQPDRMTSRTAASLSAQMAKSLASSAVSKSKNNLSRQIEREADVAKVGEASCMTALCPFG